MSNAGRTLYERLGGYDVIAKFMIDYIHRIRDARFARFGGGRGTDNQMRNDQLSIDYVCKLAGGPVYYMGRDMKTSHAGLKITEAEWKANMQHLARVLDEHNVPPREQGSDCPHRGHETRRR
jgi:hemoglobin